VLDAAQLEQFRRTGTLVVRGFFARAQVEHWRDQVRAFFDDPVDGEKWWAALRRKPHSGFRLSHDPTPNNDQTLGALMASFHPRTFWSGESELLLRPPEPNKPWLGARAPHLDFPIGRSERYLVNTVIYLSDVATRGGAFMFWPGSHEVAWDYFRRNPLDYCSRGNRSQGDTFRALAPEVSGIVGDPVEFTGSAGDLLLWHSFLLHSASINRRPETRIAVLGRWGSPRAAGDQPFRFDDGIWAPPHWRFQSALYHHPINTDTA